MINLALTEKEKYASFSDQKTVNFFKITGAQRVMIKTKSSKESILV